ncbi:MAG: DUF305 domain-containing protein [Synechococcales cyanobacterium C42_A2020_086]|jgi:uncharacterized protein (DUF305 family)|nr:DUF305 domain-containing protein [Synechococcales cyanobacterium C42_A2020_086]
MIMQLRSMAFVAMASLGIVIPVALSQRLVPSPANQSANNSAQNLAQNNGMMHHGGMMHDMQVSSEFDYLTQMIPHHQEAIDSAQLVLAGSNRPEMKRFAEEIIQVQSAEIKQMQQWLSEWYPERDTTVSYNPMMRNLDNLQGDALDQTFLEDMVVHHMGAVMMSQMLLNRNLVEHEPVRPFAQEIATTQRQEIIQMQTWLQDWFNVTGMPGHGPGMMH